MENYVIKRKKSIVSAVVKCNYILTFYSKRNINIVSNQL